MFSLPSGDQELKAGEAKLSVRLEAVQNGVKLAKTYTFSRGSYAIDVTHEISNATAAPIAPLAPGCPARTARWRGCSARQRRSPG